jgi:hypothetical protein
MRNDVGVKFIGPEYFYNIENANYDDILGANKILMPEEIFSIDSDYSVDGIFDFSYLNAENIPTEVSIAVINGTVYKNWLTDPSVIYTGLTPGKCQFSMLNDQVIIANGLDYQLKYNGTTVSEMGAPYATNSGEAGNPTGTYYYAMTYVTTGGEEVIGTVSNTITVTTNKINLDIPIGYAGTTSRKIYRTINGGNELFLLTTIADNETLTYTDNTIDGALGVIIPAINNECPKVRYLTVSYERLVGAGDALKPTQAWVGDPEIEVFDAANFINVTNIDEDGSSVTGLALDYSKVIIGSEKAIYVMDVSTEVPTTSSTRANVGVASGYSMAKVPVSKDFPGGVMFLSTLGDIRLFNGNFAQPVATSLDNLAADNYSQPIRKTMEYYVTAQTNVNSIFFDYKYHIILNSIILIFDIRVQGWAIYRIRTDSYSPEWNCFCVINNTLYAGQFGASVIDQFYSTIRYRGEEVPSIIQSGQLMAGNIVRYINDYIMYLVIGADDAIEIEIILDGNDNHPIIYQVELRGGSFDQQFFSPQDFDTGQNSEDYRVVHIDLWARWIQWTIRQTKGRTFFRGFKLTWQDVKNSE